MKLTSVKTSVNRETGQMDLKVITIDTAEWALSLKEMNIWPAGRDEMHRWQFIKVVRPEPEGIVEYEEDLGPSKSFRQIPFIILGAVFTDGGRFCPIHTVGELRAMAEQMRAGPDEVEESTPVKVANLLESYANYIERKEKDGCRS